MFQDHYCNTNYWKYSGNTSAGSIPIKMYEYLQLYFLECHSREYSTSNVWLKIHGCVLILISIFIAIPGVLSEVHIPWNDSWNTIPWKYSNIFNCIFFLEHLGTIPGSIQYLWNLLEVLLEYVFRKHSGGNWKWIVTVILTRSGYWNTTPWSSQYVFR